ncbi:hypothetical protein BER92_02810 [Xanthomonas fragariae]|nr:hypothetical protein BER92_02810 [Xanthomonas fragariae]
MLLTWKRPVRRDRILDINLTLRILTDRWIIRIGFFHRYRTVTAVRLQLIGSFVGRNVRGGIKMYTAEGVGTQQRGSCKICKIVTFRSQARPAAQDGLTAIGSFEKQIGMPLVDTDRTCSHDDFGLLFWHCLLLKDLLANAMLGSC